MEAKEELVQSILAGIKDIQEFLQYVHIDDLKLLDNKVWDIAYDAEESRNEVLKGE